MELYRQAFCSENYKTSYRKNTITRTKNDDFFQESNFVNPIVAFRHNPCKSPYQISM